MQASNGDDRTIGIMEVSRVATHIGGNERGEAAMADDAPLQRALEDPPQPLLLLQHRLQLRHLRAQPFNPSDKPPLPTEQRRRPSMHGARARSVCSSPTDGRTDRPTSNSSSRRFSRCSSRSMRKYMSFILHRRTRGLLKPAPGLPRRRCWSEEEEEE